MSLVNVNSVKSSNMDLADMLVNDKNKVTFQLDNGAEVNILSSHGNILIQLQRE